MTAPDESKLKSCKEWVADEGIVAFEVMPVRVRCDRRGCLNEPAFAILFDLGDGGRRFSLVCPAHARETADLLRDAGLAGRFHEDEKKNDANAPEVAR